jgi:hypothetical protein
VPCSIGNGTAAVSLATSTEILRLTSEGSLVNFSFLCSAERHAVRFKFKNSFRSLSGHVVNGILITEPITTLHGVIEVPSPIILMHVAKSGIDTTLKNITSNILSKHSFNSKWQPLEIKEFEIEILLFKI